MNVSYNVAAPGANTAAAPGANTTAPAAAPQTNEKKESGGMFGWLGSLFGGSSAPAAAVGGRRRTHKGRKGKRSTRRKGSRRSHRK